MASNENTYVSHLTKDNVVALSQKIHVAIKDFVDNEFEDNKIDVFLVLASLQQASYDTALHALVADEKMKQQSIDQMILIADKLTKVIDDTRHEVKTNPSSEILSAIHVGSILTEFYARLRDEKL